jgi:predicted ATP-dependent serine protease
MENKPTIARIFDIAENYRPLGRPILTAVSDFDKAMDGGIRGGEMVVLTGAQKQGKTSYAMWLTKQIVDSGVPCLWFTYEMNPWYLKEKFEALGAKEDFATFVPIDHSGNTDDWLEERILEAQKTQACKIVFIDHLHYLVPFEQEKSGNSSLFVGAIARKLKSLAVRTDSIIFLIAHSRRLAEGERVGINTIRDSALIGHEADYVFSVERLKKKEKKFKSLEEVMAGNQTNYSKISMVANRRTGSEPFKLFAVDRGNFIELSDNQIESIKDEVII